MADASQFAANVLGIAGKRLTYTELTVRVGPGLAPKQSANILPSASKL